MSPVVNPHVPKIAKDNFIQNFRHQTAQQCANLRIRGELAERKPLVAVIRIPEYPCARIDARAAI